MGFNPWDTGTAQERSELPGAVQEAALAGAVPQSSPPPPPSWERPAASRHCGHRPATPPVTIALWGTKNPCPVHHGKAKSHTAVTATRAPSQRLHHGKAMEHGAFPMDMDPHIMKYRPSPWNTDPPHGHGTSDHGHRPHGPSPWTWTLSMDKDHMDPSPWTWILTPRTWTIPMDMKPHTMKHRPFPWNTDPPYGQGPSHHGTHTLPTPHKPSPPRVTQCPQLQTHTIQPRTMR